MDWTRHYIRNWATLGIFKSGKNLKTLLLNVFGQTETFFPILAIIQFSHSQFLQFVEQQNTVGFTINLCSFIVFGNHFKNSMSHQPTRHLMTGAFWSHGSCFKVLSSFEVTFLFFFSSSSLAFCMSYKQSLRLLD